MGACYTALKYDRIPAGFNRFVNKMFIRFTHLQNLVPVATPTSLATKEIG